LKKAYHPIFNRYLFFASETNTFHILCVESKEIELEIRLPEKEKGTENVHLIPLLPGSFSHWSHIEVTSGSFWRSRPLRLLGVT
jgi:hypothetical protein